MKLTKRRKTSFIIFIFTWNIGWFVFVANLIGKIPTLMTPILLCATLFLTCNAVQMIKEIVFDEK